jgi:hypothetical protein
LSKTSTASLTDTLTIGNNFHKKYSFLKLVKMLTNFTAKAGKGVVSGLFNGVIGVVKNPINGKLF